MTSNSHVLWITCKHNTNTVQCGLNDTCLCHNKGEVNISHGACRVFYSKRERKRKKPVLFLLSSMTKAHIRYWVIAEIFYRQENMLAKNNPSLMLNPQPDRVWTPNLRAWAAPSIRCCHEFRQAGHEQCVLKYSTLFGNCSIKPKSEYLYTPAIISPQKTLFPKCTIWWSMKKEKSKFPWVFSKQGSLFLSTETGARSITPFQIKSGYSQWNGDKGFP